MSRPTRRGKASEALSLEQYWSRKAWGSVEGKEHKWYIKTHIKPELMPNKRYRANLQNIHRPIKRSGRYKVPCPSGLHNLRVETCHCK